MNMSLADKSPGAGLQPRRAWLDAARASALLLVVIGHCERGLVAAGALGRTAESFDRIIYSFHIPLFFLISGMLFAESTRRLSFLASWGPRMMRLIKPYAFWSVVLLLLLVLASSSANAPVSARQALVEILLLPILPVSIFWFLYTLVICTAFSGLALEYFRLTPRQLLIWSALIHAIYLLLLTDQQSGFGLPLVRFAEHQLYFAAGCFMASLAARERGSLGPSATKSIAGACAIVFLMSISAMTIAGISYHSVLGTVAALSGAATVLCCCYLLFALWRWPMPRLVAGMARHSLAIFCMHVPFLAVTRIVSLRLGIDSGWANLLLGTAAGIAGPLISLAVLDRLGLTRFTGLDSPTFTRSRQPGGLLNAHSVAGAQSPKTTPGARSSGRM